MSLGHAQPGSEAARWIIRTLARGDGRAITINGSRAWYVLGREMPLRAWAKEA